MKKNSGKKWKKKRIDTDDKKNMYTQNKFQDLLSVK